MAGAKEIRTKIASVKNTQKITSAMQMVAASKMRRAQERMSSSRPYSLSLSRIISHIASGHTEYRHPYMQEREIKNIGYIIISTDRGLCGGLNINLFRKVLNEIRNNTEQNIGVKATLLGTKASAFFWLGNRDSNPNKQSQSLSCYRYTIPQDVIATELATI